MLALRITAMGICVPWCAFHGARTLIQATASIAKDNDVIRGHRCGAGIAGGADRAGRVLTAKPIFDDAMKEVIAGQFAALGVVEETAPQAAVRRR